MLCHGALGSAEVACAGVVARGGLGQEGTVKYRTLGRIGLRVGELGLGTEHIDTGDPAIAAAIVEQLVAAGGNYIDMLYNDPERHAKWWSVMRPAVTAHRDELVLCAHYGWTDYYEQGHCGQCFERVLDMLGGRAEVGMLTKVDTRLKWETWALPSLEELQRHRDAGRIGGIGLSTHSRSIAETAIAGGLVDVIMYPIEISTHHKPEDVSMLTQATEAGVGLVAMKTYAGDSWLHATDTRPALTPAQCIAASLGFPVATVVPGCRTPTEYAAAVAGYGARAQDKEYVAVTPLFRGELEGTCTYCDHCLPFTVDIAVGRMNRLVDERDLPFVERLDDYRAMPVPASECTECGICMERCPFGVDVIAKMRKAVETFERA